ncbi:MAG: heme-dependent peroxidase [Alicyclobacillus sp.]|nr:heme-dependent peroxidase [Alicyclobacillus sp.]
MSEAVSTLDGWYAYHDFRRMNWPLWKQASSELRRAALADLKAWVAGLADDEASRRGSYGQYAVAGGKADLLWLHMRPSIEELNEVKHRFAKTRFADFTVPAYSYVSVVELSAYLAKPGVDVETDPYLQGRLKPVLPKDQHVCFYPMNKRRLLGDNWYTLSMEERREMMKSHGLIGRQYAGKVRQIITGSIGFDDWEWGVTLYAEDPLQFKKLVYEMRFDEASARFGEFGPFYVGAPLTDTALATMLQV